MGPRGSPARRMLNPVMLSTYASAILSPAEVWQMLRVSDNYLSGPTSLYRP